MKHLIVLLLLASFLVGINPATAATPTKAADAPSGKSLLGHPDFYPSPEHTVGWLGDLSGRYPGAQDFPLEWNTATGKNILWKAELPGYGHSSPIVVGKKVFLTIEPDVTVCLDADTGKVLWQQSGHALGTAKGIYSHATEASMGTVCSDGKNLFVTHYNGVVASYDFDGKVRWRKDVFATGWTSASPVLVDGKFIVFQGSSAKSTYRGPWELVAYNCESGEIVWHNTGVISLGSWHTCGMVPMWVEGTPYLVNYLGQFVNARDGRLVAQLWKTGGGLWVPTVEGDTVVIVNMLANTDNWRVGMQDLAKVDLQEPTGREEAQRRLEKKGPVARGKGLFYTEFDTLIVPLKVTSDGKDGLRFQARQKPALVQTGGDFCRGLLSNDILYFTYDGNHFKPKLYVFDLKSGAFLNPGGYDGLEIKPTIPAPNGLFNGSAFLYPHTIATGDYLTLSDWGGRTHMFTRTPDLREVAVNLTETSKKPPAGNPISGPAGGVASSEFYQGNRIYFRNWDTLYCIGDTKATEQAAAFAAAKAHADAGRIAEAQKAYHQLWNAEPLHVRYRAIREMGVVLGAQAVDEFCQAFRHTDPNLQALAVSVAARIPGEEVTHKLAEGLKDTDPGYRCRVLDVLGQRADRSVAPQVAAALEDTVPEVRIAALDAAGRIGGVAALRGIVAHLDRLSEPERQLALMALIGMLDAETEKCLIDLVPQSSPAAKAVLLRIIGNRGWVAQTGLVLKEMGNTDRSVRLAALETLGIIGGVPEMDPIVDRVRLAADDEERRAIEGTLSGILKRTKATDAYTSAVLRALTTANGPGLASLIRALGSVGGNAALTEVRKAVANKDAAIHGAAIEAMATWPDITPEPDLMVLAKGETDAKNLTVIVHGLLHMIDLSPTNRPADQVFPIYEQAIKTKQDMEVTVAHMGGLKDPRVIELLASLLGEKKISREVLTTAIISVADGVSDKDVAKTIALLKPLGGKGGKLGFPNSAYCGQAIDRLNARAKNTGLKPAVDDVPIDPFTNP